MNLTNQLIQLFVSKAIEEEDIKVASWFVMDAMAKIPTRCNSELGRILIRWFLEESSNTSRTVLEVRTVA